MAKLHWLVGEWHFSDVSTNGEYRETGTRHCRLVLHDRYILCESVGRSGSGHERSYYFILGHNRMDNRYEMIGLTSSYPRQNLYIVTPDETGHTLQLVNHFWTDEGLLETSHATIEYNGSDQYVWRIRSGDMTPGTGERAVTFVDTVTRKLPPEHPESGSASGQAMKSLSR